MVKQCTGHPDRQEPRIPSHFETIQQARKAAEALSEELAWATNTLRDREARIAQLESTVASLVAEVAEVKANANTALREACADAGKGGPCSREGCSRPRGPHGWCEKHRCSSGIEDGPGRYRVC